MWNVADYTNNGLNMRNSVTSVLLFLALSVSGCGVEDKEAKAAYFHGEANFQSPPPHVEFIWPGGFGSEVGSEAAILVMLSEPVVHAYGLAASDIASSSELLEMVDGDIGILSVDDGSIIDADISLGPVADDFTNAAEIILKPSEALNPGKEYRVSLSGSLQEFFGDIGENNTVFTTKYSGRSALFDVTDIYPLDSGWPVPDFATLRIRFSGEPAVDTVRYGESVQIRSQDNDRLVSARVLVQGRLLVIDPLEALVPGVAYELTLKDISDSYGEPLAEYRRTFTSTATMQRQRMVQTMGVSPGQSCEHGSGAPYYRDNCLYADSAILGELEVALQQSSMAVELASASGFRNVIPFRMMKGEVMQASSIPMLMHGIPVKSNGAVMETGPLTLTLLSDGLGYMLPNRFNRDAPYEFRIHLDLAVTAQNPAAAPLINQQVVGVEVAGLVNIDPALEVGELDRLELFGVSSVPLNLANLETVYTTLRLSGEAVLDTVWDPVKLEQDITPLSLVNINPPLSEPLRPGIPLVLDFNEPLDGALLPEDLYLTNAATGATIATGFSTEVRGSRLIVRRNQVVGGRTENLHLGYAVRDMAGNPLDTDHNLLLSMPNTGPSPARRMLPTYTYPGYPCAKRGSVTSTHQGYCRNASDASAVSLPIQSLSANEPIQMAFTQPVDPASVQGAIKVQRQSGEQVAGKFSVNSNRISFMPDTPWEDGVLYVYRIDGEGADALRSISGQPLATLALGHEGKLAAAGQISPSLDNYFYGAPRSERLPMGFEIWPAADINGDLNTGSGEQTPYSMTTGTMRLRIADTNDGRGVSGHSVANDGSGIDLGIGIYKANIGCGFDFGNGVWWDVSRYIQQSCPENRVFSITGAMMAHMEGYDSVDQSIRLRLVPGILYSTAAPDIYITYRKPFDPADYVDKQTIGPTVMQVRYENGMGPVGKIKSTPDGAVLEARIKAFLAAPEMVTTTTDDCGHRILNDMSSRSVDIKLSGRIEIDEDGRMLATLYNTENVPIDTYNWSEIPCNRFLVGDVGIYFNVHFEIPPGGVNMQLVLVNEN